MAALRVQQSMLHRTCVLSAIGWSAAISACETGKQQWEALRLFQEILQRTCTTDLAGHSASISAHETGEQWWDSFC